MGQPPQRSSVGPVALERGSKLKLAAALGWLIPVGLAVVFYAMGITVGPPAPWALGLLAGVAFYSLILGAVGIEQWGLNHTNRVWTPTRSYHIARVKPLPTDASFFGAMGPDGSSPEDEEAGGAAADADAVRRMRSRPRETALGHLLLPFGGIDFPPPIGFYTETNEGIFHLTNPHDLFWGTDGPFVLKETRLADHNAVCQRCIEAAKESYPAWFTENTPILELSPLIDPTIARSLATSTEVQILALEELGTRGIARDFVAVVQRSPAWQRMSATQQQGFREAVLKWLNSKALVAERTKPNFEGVVSLSNTVRDLRRQLTLSEEARHDLENENREYRKRSLGQAVREGRLSRYSPPTLPAASHQMVDDLQGSGTIGR